MESVAKIGISFGMCAKMCLLFSRQGRKREEKGGKKGIGLKESHMTICVPSIIIPWSRNDYSVVMESLFQGHGMMLMDRV